MILRLIKIINILSIFTSESLPTKDFFCFW